MHTAMPMRYQQVKYGGLSVSYLPHLDGGGQGFGQAYVPVVRELFGKVGRVYEFCAGPAFIGFSLLAHGCCDSLCLADVNPDAVDAARATVRRNRLENRVSVYLSDGLCDIPPEEKWDLVVSNPPHFKDCYADSLRHYDEAWRLHSKFYSDVARFLTPSGSVLVQENYEGSDEDDFVGMIAAGGLAYRGGFMYRDPAARNYFDSYYFMWAQSALAQVSPLPMGDSIVYANGPANVYDVVLIDSTNEVLHIEAGRRTKFRFHNKLGRQLRLLVYAYPFGVIPRFLRSFGEVAPDADSASYTFQFLPGKYLLSDEDTKRTLCRINAS